MTRATLAGLALTLAGSLACGCAGTGGSTADPPARSYTLVFIKTGPKSGQLPADETRTLFAGHFSNMQRMAEERQLLVAGPFGETRHDPALRGIFVLDTGDLDRARQIASTDPPTQAGIFVLDFHSLSTDAPLRAMHERVMQLDQQAEAKAKAEGRERKPGEGGRSFVLLTAEDGERAAKALRAAPGGLVLLSARLDGSQTFALLDAPDPDAARAQLGEVAGQLGPFVLDGWYASAELVHLPEMH